MLKVQNLSYQWGHQKIFQDISFEVESSQLVRIGGANGAGKTTLLKVLAGLLKPMSGNFTFSRNKLSSKHYYDYLPASCNGLFLELTAKENLYFWHKLYKSDDTQDLNADSIDQILNKWLPLKDHLVKNLAVKKFSTGMQRRLSFARLEACSRACLLLDEPTSGMDRDGVTLFQLFLKEHLRNSGSAIVVTHSESLLLPEMEPQTIVLSQL